MARSYYSNFVEHCMRFYARYPDPKFKTKTDKLNWFACKKAIFEFSNREQEWIMEIYKNADTIPDNVYQLAQREKIDQDEIWKLLVLLEKKIAKTRGLI